MKRKLSHITTLLMVVVAFSLIGCALVQKPPTNSDEKAAWIENTKFALTSAATGENLAFIGFSLLCAENTIDQKTCDLVPALNTAWQTDYQAALDAVDKYGKGEITQVAAQTIVNQALLKSLVEVMAGLKKNAADPAKAKAMTLRSGDLSAPAGQTKGVKPKK